MKQQTEYTEYQIEEADTALDSIDGAAKKVVDIVEAVTKIPGVEYVSFVEWNDFVGTIEDALCDLFCKDRNELMSIAGHRPYPKSLYHKSSDALFEAFKPNNRHFRPMPTRGMVQTNPQTRPENFEGDLA